MLRRASATLEPVRLIHVAAPVSNGGYRRVHGNVSQLDILEDNPVTTTMGSDALKVGSVRRSDSLDVPVGDLGDVKVEYAAIGLVDICVALVMANGARSPSWIVMLFQLKVLNVYM